MIVMSITRPLALSPARAQVSTVAAGAPVTYVLRDPNAGPVTRTQLTVDTPWLPQVHQVRVQAELALGAVRSRGSYGITGSTVESVEAGAKKRFIDARGVPPRGRPV